MFEVDALINANTLMETKNSKVKIKINNMNDDSSNEATNQPISLNNEATPYAVVSERAALASTAIAAASTATTFTIVPE